MLHQRTKVQLTHTIYESIRGTYPNISMLYFTFHPPSSSSIDSIKKVNCTHV